MTFFLLLLCPQVERHVSKLNGVVSVAVNLMAANARVEIDPALSGPRDIINGTTIISLILSRAQLVQEALSFPSFVLFSFLFHDTFLYPLQSSSFSRSSLSFFRSFFFVFLFLSFFLFCFRCCGPAINALGFTATLPDTERKNEARDRRGKEIKDYKNLFLVSLLLTVPIALISMVFMFIHRVRMTTWCCMPFGIWDEELCLSRCGLGPIMPACF
jgi:hypothetical protein